MKSDIDVLMKERNLDAILVLGNAEHNPPMYYFTGGGHVSNAALFKKRGQDAVIYCNAMEREEAMKSGLRVIPTRQGAMDELIKNAKQVFEDQGITSGRVGVYGTFDVGMTLALLQTFMSAVPEVEGAIHTDSS